jgi:hypothetical protein
MSYTLVNQVSVAPNNSNTGYNNSWLRVANDANRELFAQASYVTNFEDFTVSLSAGDVNIGSVEIKDGNSSRRADVVDAGGGLNALRVISQDLESSVDDITIGDKNGNFAYVTNSALNVFVTNGISAVSLTNQLTGITVLNPITAVNANITNTVAISTTQTLPISGSVTVLNPVTQITTSQEPTQLDAFGRLRTSSPMTLFDSSHRYRDNNLWASLTAVGGTYAFNQNQGLIEMTVGALSGSSVIRETTKVFSYQPGKSLLVMNTFVMASSTANLRQRVGYFGQDNGIYFQLDDGVMSFVERTLVNGSPSTETIVPVSAWNGDKLNGTGPSGFTLDITKAQILWTDIEWLGVGTVRTGFVIDGKFIVCHSFHHANRIASTYITTASLPLRYEITNKTATGGTKTLKQVCSTVISEGGYELRGLQQAIGTTITAPKALTTLGTHYPVVSIRLKASPNRLDAIVILTALSIMGVGSGIYDWRVIAAGTTSGGGAWQDAGVDSAVEYKLDGTSITGGRILAQGYLTSSFQQTVTTDILKEALFKFQLERNGLTGVPYELTIAVAASSNTESVHASMDWEEISR